MKYAIKLNTQTSWQLCLAFILTAAVMMLPDLALAGSVSDHTPTSINHVLCNVVNWFKGPIGRGIATIAIIVIGIGALMGKVSWGMAIIVGLGVAIIFGADTILNALGADGAAACTTGSALS